MGVHTLVKSPPARGAILRSPSRYMLDVFINYITAYANHRSPFDL